MTIDKDKIREMLDHKYNILKSMRDYDTIGEKHEAWIKAQEKRWIKKK